MTNGTLMKVESIAVLHRKTNFLSVLNRFYYNFKTSAENLVLNNEVC